MATTGKMIVELVPTPQFEQMCIRLIRDSVQEAVRDARPVQPESLERVKAELASLADTLSMVRTVNEASEARRALVQERLREMSR